ncbi:glycosyltransferase family 4 protein [Flavobacterium sp. N1994]|uniref:glycosyltransferase family 4 protein n=1 Tax=Flavobacterium sp. N1994 TaxID=2986827 RepID=UPI002223CF46|nr:glycosyltransferase family 4 protein [Flavobacterium sp. N1994]
MKTVLIAHNYSVTTFSAMSYYFAHHLADTGHKVIFISHKPFFSEKQMVKTEKGEIHLYSWSSEKRPTSIADFIWFSKIYREHKPDIVIGHFVGTNISFIVSKLLSFWKVKTYEHYHTLSDQILTDLKKMSLKQRLLFFRRKLFYPIFCDQIICTSQLGKEDLESFFGAKNSFVLLGPMVDRFESKKPISKDSIIISFLGRLDPSKGVIDLIEAFFKYKQKNPSSKISINIGGSGRLEAEIKELIKDNDSINFVGPLTYDKVDDYFNQSHFSIIPSKIDNLPTVGLESLMNQTPILISNNTGLTQYLVDGKDCFKFDANVDAMISLLEKVEAKFEDCHEQMSIEARKTFMDKFSVKTYCEDFSKAIL